MVETIPSWADAELSADLPRLAANGETQAIEFKRELPKHLGDLAKEVAAFATSNAGTILIGIADSGEIVGLENGADDNTRRDLLGRLEGLFNQIKPTITPSLRYGVYEDAIVAAIEVPKGAQPIYYAASIPYHRQLTAARPMAPEDVVERVLQWHMASGDTENPETEFLGNVASLWPHVDLMLSERMTRSRSVKPWSERLRWQAGVYAEHARSLAANAPHELEALVSPLNDLADSLSIIANERPSLGSQRIEILGAQQDAEQIICEVRARYLSPSRFGRKAAERQRATIRAEAKLLDNLVMRISSDQHQVSVKSIQAEAGERGQTLFIAASLGVGMGTDERRAELRAIAVSLREIETAQLYHDGGRSVNAVLDATRAANERLQSWLSTLTEQNA